MQGYSHLCDVLKEREIDVAHIDQSLTYRENCQLLKSQFGVVPRKVDYRLKYREAEGALQGALSREGMLAKANIPAKAEKPARAAKERPAEPQRPGLPGPNLPFDPIERGKASEEIVMRGNTRLFYRFRNTDFYGGIITCDAMGCNLLCAHCWNYGRNENPIGKTFLSPEQAAKKIVDMCAKEDQWYCRMSGCEPILGEQSARYFKALMDACDDYAIEKYEECPNWILETNGIVLGYTPQLLEVLTGNYMTIRISFKGHNEEVFQAVTGAKGEYWKCPIEAFKKCQEIGIQVIPACMPAFSDKTKLEELIGEPITDIERLRAYSKGTPERMRERGLEKYRR